MSQFLGKVRLSLCENDLNILLATFIPDLDLIFKSGCFSLRTKLPMGLGVSLIAVPRATPDSLVFSIPFEQIRGEKTGAMAAMLAGGLWGLIRPILEKRIRNELYQLKMSENTVVIGHTSEGKNKIGTITLYLAAVNSWLMHKTLQQGYQLSLAAIEPERDRLSCVLRVFRPKSTLVLGQPAYN